MRKFPWMNLPSVVRAVWGMADVTVGDVITESGRVVVEKQVAEVVRVLNAEMARVNAEARHRTAEAQRDVEMTIIPVAGVSVMKAALATVFPNVSVNELFLRNLFLRNLFLRNLFL